MTNGKSDLHVHFHGDVAAGASLVINVPSVAGISAQIADLKESLLKKSLLSKELSEAIELLSTKAQAADDVVQDSTPSPAD